MTRADDYGRQLGLMSRQAPARVITSGDDADDSLGLLCVFRDDVTFFIACAGAGASCRGLKKSTAWSAEGQRKVLAHAGVFPGVFRVLQPRGSTLFYPAPAYIYC